jgi:two-component system LytT family sensor kinase
MHARVSLKRPRWLLWPSGRQTSAASLYWPLQGAGWTAFGILLVLRELDRYSLRYATIVAASSVAVGFALSTGFRGLFRLWRQTGTRVVRLSAGIAAVVTLGATAWQMAESVLFQLLAELASPGGISALRVAQSPLDSWMLYALALLSWSLLYFAVNTWVSLELERRKAVRFQSSAQAARLRALQAQLEPHFIFNTLNSISSLVVEGRDQAATAMIAKLSDFLRLTLQTSGTPEILLANELVFVRQYLELQQLRFGDRLRYLISVEPGAANAMVPALLLQPLVENAVRHGILSRATGGLVKVAARALDGALYIEVEDDGLGMRKISGLSSGLGLSSIATRLNEHYGNESKFHVGRSTAGGVAISIRIPLHFEPRIRTCSEPEESES